MSDPYHPAEQRDAVSLLETELAEILNAVSDTFTEMRRFDSGEIPHDEFGRSRATTVSTAVSLLKVSAELGHAIAKIRGKSSHNINVLHGDIWPPPRRVVAKPQCPEEAVPSAEVVDEAIAATVAPFATCAGDTPSEK